MRVTMHPYFGDRWCQRMRRPDVVQTRGAMFDPETGGMCALGVLIDLLADDGMCTTDMTDSGWMRAVQRVLPRTLYDWAIFWNDERQMSLPEIADRVEAWMAAHPPQEPVWTPEAVDAGALAEPDLVAV